MKIPDAIAAIVTIVAVIAAGCIAYGVGYLHGTDDRRRFEATRRWERVLIQPHEPETQTRRCEPSTATFCI
jgi:hypothetical protein